MSYIDPKRWSKEEAGFVVRWSFKDPEASQNCVGGTFVRGLAELESKKPLEDNTIFHVASVSKQFTVYLILDEVLKGKLALDQDVRLYDSTFPNFDEKVTLRHLIHHTSGLRDQWELLRTAGWHKDDVVTQGQVP